MRKRWVTLNPEVQERLVKATQLGLSWRHAAAYANISRTTLFNWRKRGEQEEDGPYRELVDAMEAAEGEMIAANMAHIRKAAGEGAWQAAAWTLERRHPEEYAKYRDRPDVVDREARAAEAATAAPVVDQSAVLASLPIEVLEELLAARKRSE
jgi:hypothetical protein